MLEVELKVGDVVTVGDVEITVVDIGYTVRLAIAAPGCTAVITRGKVIGTPCPSPDRFATFAEWTRPKAG